ncbi:Cytochrome c oxidase assembly protein cox15 [Entomortierella chlamydospora]|uniref:Cytochrome c oxidase assembly protein cox15 n=1 Tax=Entomortierella chlamydospora TaxID=101097 RepID=A0A9P6N193_9FUNG|nr:Cytochrome c oxidase assembly protein cox15 [Entomortierella chlamydospora]KAG0021448.1 Cytochrome c oxidase assembly protein cox15 [Entomortierella chlamydospora]
MVCTNAFSALLTRTLVRATAHSSSAHTLPTRTISTINLNNVFRATSSRSVMGASLTRIAAQHQNVRSTALMVKARFQSTIAASSASNSVAAASASAASTAVKAAPDMVVKPVVGYWMFTISAMTFGIVVLGGLTRLTESGLSIVEWNLIKGMKPPRSQAEWEEEFEKYKQFPEYKLLNHGMSLEEFKRIFYYEWSHRMLGRAIGAAFILPGIFFAARGMLSKSIARRSLIIGGLIGFQGALGWYMVKSGLDEQLMSTPGATPRVSQYRLAAHLGSAFLIYAGTFMTGLKILTDYKISKGAYESLAAAINNPILKRFKGAAHGIVALVFMTALSGAFVAGLDAGLVYNEFPLMGGRLMPPVNELFDSHYLHKNDHPTLGLWRNMFDNQVTVQFNHRVLATSTFTAISALFLYSRNLPLPLHARLGVNILLGVACGQVGLGIATLLYMVPVSLGTAHQAGSLTLLTAAMYLMHSLKKVPLAKKIPLKV